MLLIIVEKIVETILNFAHFPKKYIIIHVCVN